MSFDEGWHVDPANPRQERHWNGTAWSGQWREVGAFQADLTPRPAPPPTPSEPYLDRSSRSAWLIATSPLWLPVPYAALSLFGIASESAAASRVGYLALIAVLLLLAASRDRVVLRDSGVPRAASPLWMLLTPMSYLIVRHRSLLDVPGYRSSPLLVHLLCIGVVALVAGVLVMVSGLPFLIFGSGGG